MQKAFTFYNLPSFSKKSPKIRAAVSTIRGQGRLA